MNEGTCKGIVFRSYPYSETSLILHCLTDRLGMVSVLAKGARRPNSAFVGRLDLFYLCSLELILSRRSDLHTLREVSLLDAHAELGHNYSLLLAVTENARLVERLIERSTPVPEVFNLFCDYLHHIPRHTSSVVGEAVFKIRLAALLGHLPRFDALSLSPEEEQLTLDLLKRPWQELLSFVPSAGELRSLSAITHRCIQYE